MLKNISLKLAIKIYKTTESFPKDEIFGLTNQLRRCAVSITSNIAEGFGRAGSKDKVHFYLISQGSVYELQSQILIAKDVNYINKSEFDEIAGQTVTVNKLLSGLIKKIKNG